MSVEKEMGAPSYSLRVFGGREETETVGAENVKEPIVHRRWSDADQVTTTPVGRILRSTCKRVAKVHDDNFAGG